MRIELMICAFAVHYLTAWLSGREGRPVRIELTTLDLEGPRSTNMSYGRVTFLSLSLWLAYTQGESNVLSKETSKSI